MHPTATIATAKYDDAVYIVYKDNRQNDSPDCDDDGIEQYAMEIVVAAAAAAVAVAVPCRPCCEADIFLDIFGSFLGLLLFLDDLIKLGIRASRPQ